MKHCTLIPIKDQKAMYVGGVESGVCGFYTTLHTEYCTHVGGVEGYCTLYAGPLAPPGGKAIHLSLPPCGFSSSPPVSLRRQLC